MKRRPGCCPSGAIKINLVALSLYAGLIVGGYSGYKFLPLWWEREEIKNMMGEVAISAGRSSDLDMREKIWSLMQSNFQTELPKEKIRVWRKDEKIFIEVQYRRRVHHFWGKDTVLNLAPRVERIIL